MLQSDPGWLAARRGLLTASRMTDVFDIRKDGKPGASRVKLMKELLAERIADWAVDHPVTAPMRRGLDLEPDARDAYEAATGNIAAPAELILHPVIDGLASTPDGFIAPDGLLEIKVPLVTTYLDWILDGKVPEQHVPQLLCQLACTRRRWTDFVAYCPEMPPKKRLFIRHFEPRPEDIAAVESAAVAFLRELDELFEKIAA